MKINLSISSVAALVPGDEEYTVWDSKTRGFGVRVGKAGTKAFVLKYVIHGRQRKMTLGLLGDVTVEEARRKATAARGKVADGVDPQEARDEARDGVTVEAAWREFMDGGEGKWAANTASAYRLSYARHIGPALGKRLVGSIRFADIEALHRKLRTRPYMANRVAAAVSSFWRYCRLRRWVEGDNPCRDLARYEERVRERVLTDAEIARLGEALAADDTNIFATTAIKLILLLGCRKGEVLGLRWSDVDLDTGIARLPETKTGARTVYLGNNAIAILRELPRLPDNPYVICGHLRGAPMVNLSKPWSRVAAAADLDGVRLHDLRRTFGSRAVSSGQSIYAVSKLLGHASVKMTEDAYAFMAREPLQKAANAIADDLGRTLAGEGNVVPMRRRPA